MKRTIILVLITTFMVLGLAMLVHSQAKIIVKEEIAITVDRTQVRTDVPPINVDGRILVPVRGVFEAFDAEIQWFPRERRVYVREDTKVIWLRIGENHAQVNDDIVPLQVPALLYRGRTMVPLRFIAETLGATVTWDETARTVTIVTRSRAAIEPDYINQG